ncbi:ATP-binding cassette domain-containing protein [Streptoalloteichus tenebrarius]|uniref:ATP-binding cassette domain-containing protein n=1 Tax=Streptoalloteichus tenebrarius (strain ATCC 17920 / DSM 40477 / JCM 4838 / CBS 697.72 / NBRC 16177 / NCIMB 11028 / NRRL B-12390 / A12253. 1 / ISP 5477) TaxID=1933 RepID=UPI0020A3880F|nr:ABC transporter ATP-binding protein [Streptoalloteichus tenebrarius]
MGRSSRSSRVVPWRRPAAPGGAWRLYRHALSGCRRPVLVLAAWSLVEGVPGALSGHLLGLAVDRGFAAGRTGEGVFWLALFGAVAVLGALGARRVFAGLGDVVEPLRDALVTAVTRGVLVRGTGGGRLPEGAVVARLTRHVEVVRDVTGGLLVQARSLVVTAVAAVVGLVVVARELAWFVVPPLVFAIGLFVALLPSLVRRQQEVVFADERAAEAAATVLTGFRDVVACGARQQAAGQVVAEVDAQERTAVRLASASALREVVVAVGGYLPLALVLVVAPGLVAAGRMSAGAVVAAVAYLTTGVQPALRSLVQVVGSAAVRLVVTTRRLAEVSVPKPVAETREPSGISGASGFSASFRASGISGTSGPCGAVVVQPPSSPLSPPEVSVRGLTFRWGPRAEPVIRDLDLDLPPGEHLALVGPSGIGKSTVVRLLTGLLPVERGEVLVGGVRVDQVDQRALRRAVALIPQEAYVFGGTVRENLALLAPGTDDASLLRSVAEVGAQSIVDRLGGLDGSLDHGGGTLSAGERQLLAAARVHASAAGLVILDEATSHLDPRAEERVEEAFVRRGGTLVVVAHRLSSAMRARRVLLLDGDGALVGRHDELRARSSLYAHLVDAWHTDVPAPGMVRS